MSNILVVGSIALDTIETPVGRRDSILGGSATLFSLSAAAFAPVRMVGVVGTDFPPAHIKLLQDRNIDTRGIETVDGKTFRWHGRYEGAMSSAQTVAVDLNVFGNFQPKIPSHYTDTEFVFLGNGSPATQGAVLDQLKNPTFVMLDSMNLWIENARKELLQQLKRVNAVCLNEGEARMLSGQNDLPSAAAWIAEHGPQTIVLKQAEKGASLFHRGRACHVTAHRVDRLMDPTGAGDSFAGGFMGSLAREGKVEWDPLKRALAMGAVMGSFTVEDFGTARLERVTSNEIQKRFDALSRQLG